MKKLSLMFASILIFVFTACTAAPEKAETGWPAIPDDVDISRTEERWLTAEELMNVIDFYGADSGKVEDYRALLPYTLKHAITIKEVFDCFLMSMPQLHRDVCRPINRWEQKIISNLGWPEDEEYYCVSKSDAEKIWSSYVDKDSPIPMEPSGRHFTYYSKILRRYYFKGFTTETVPSLAVNDGSIKGDMAQIYASEVTVSFKYTDGIWRLYNLSLPDKQKHICNRMERVTSQQLWDMRPYFLENDELLDGYRDGDFYIVYSKNKDVRIGCLTCFVKESDGEYTVVRRFETGNDWEKNLFLDEGIMPKYIYKVDCNCLPNDSSKGKLYNDAIDAYNRFLAQKAEVHLEVVNEDDYDLSLPYVYAYLKDLHGDGISELLVNTEYHPYPLRVYSYKAGEVVEIPGPYSNGMHGPVWLLESGVYVSMHYTTGWQDTFVTYNKDGTETVERFSYYSIYSYTKEIEGIIVEEQEFPDTEEGKRRFYELFELYKETIASEEMDLGKQYFPFTIDGSQNYSPYVLERYNKQHKDIIEWQ